ncbi:MAG: Orotidine 5-phosphate decarboxylase, partial [Actinomycetota bacterium]
MHSKFGKQLLEAFESRGQLCVGIDPHASLLQSWGLPDSASGIREFSLRVIDAASTRVGVIKPQVSFFERFGAAGFQVLAEVTNQAKEAGLLVIADAKRGDIGTTMDAY